MRRVAYEVGLLDDVFLMGVFVFSGGSTAFVLEPGDIVRDAGDVDGTEDTIAAIIIPIDWKDRLVPPDNHKRAFSTLLMSCPHNRHYLRHHAKYFGK